MRKLFITLLVLGIAGTLCAWNFPTTEKYNDGGAIITRQVYSASALDVGDVVVWAIGDSTGDNDNYVATTTTANTYIVAGVVYPAAIAAGEVGSIAVRGPVQVDWVSAGSSTTGNVGSPVCSSATAGEAWACQTATTSAANFGHVVTEASAGSATMYVGK
jgi:hypothetical protein